MKRVTQKGLSKLTFKQLDALLTEKYEEKEHFLNLDKTLPKGSRQGTKISGRLNTLDNQIYIINKELNSRPLRVKCICAHLGVDNGELGTMVNTEEGGLTPVVKWDNGFTESVQFDDIEFV